MRAKLRVECGEFCFLRGLIIQAVLSVPAVVSLLNLMAVKLMRQPVVMWTPWGHMAYWLFGQERPDYRFYGGYWLFLMVLLFYLEEQLNGRKDYVFEEARRVG